jgi:hypothetical protein
MQDGDIMEWVRIFGIQVDEQSMMFNDHYVVHVIHLLLPIKPRSMSRIVLGFLDFDESPINEPIT